MTLLALSTFAVLGAGAWWWVTWPERTAREFLHLLVAGRLEEVKGMISETGETNDPFEWPHHDYSHVDWKLSKLEPLRRSIGAVFQGRQRFGFKIGYQVEVERGRILNPGLLFTGRLDGFGQLTGSMADRTNSAPVLESSDSTP